MFDNTQIELKNRINKSSGVTEDELLHTITVRPDPLINNQRISTAFIILINLVVEAQIKVMHNLETINGRLVFD